MFLFASAHSDLDPSSSGATPSDREFLELLDVRGMDSRMVCTGVRGHGQEMSLNAAVRIALFAMVDSINFRCDLAK